MNYQFRLLDDEDSLFWRNAEDKISAFEEINRRNKMRGGNPYAIPYYLTGEKQHPKTEPTRFNGRLHTNAFGQTRHYLDYELAEQSNSTLLPTLNFQTESR